MARELKNMICDDLKQIFDGFEGCVLIDYRGLNSEQTASLRSSLRENGVQMNVVRNRLAKRVFVEMGAPEDFCDLIQGPTAVLFGGDGGTFAASKGVKKWRKDNPDLAAVRGGLLEGRALSAEDVQRLADIPEPEVLQATILSMFMSPATNFSSSAKSLVSHFAGCVKGAPRGAELTLGACRGSAALRRVAAATR